MILNKEQILSELKLRTEEVQLVSGSVLMSELSAADYFDLYASLSEGGEIDTVGFSQALVARCVVDEQGQHLFDQSETELLHKGSFTVFEKLSAAARRLNGLGKSAIKN